MNFSEQHEQGSNIEVLALDRRQKKGLTGRPSKRRKRRLVRSNKTAKYILRQMHEIERALLRVNNLPNNTKHVLEKKEPWKSKLSIRQHSSQT